MATAPSRTRDEAMPGLKGKNVLVTGGSSGIGQAIAVRFAEHGANVAINYLTTQDEAHDTEEQVHACVHRVRQEGVRDVLVQGDVSDEDDVVRMVGMAAEELGGLDVLVNNAGIQISRPSHELSSAHFDKVIAINLRGSFLCAREAIKQFLDRRAGRLDRQRLERPPGHPEARLPGLLVLEGRDDEPDPHAGARVRRPRDPRQRHRPGRDDHADQLGLDRRPGQEGAGREPHPDAAARARPTRWAAWRASWPATTPRTSPARRSSSTAA